MEPAGRASDPWTAKVVGEVKVKVPEVKESLVSDLRNWVESKESRRSAFRPEPDPWEIAGTVKVMVLVESLGVMVMFPEAIRSMSPSLLETPSTELTTSGLLVKLFQSRYQLPSWESRKSALNPAIVSDRVTVKSSVATERKTASPVGLIT